MANDKQTDRDLHERAERVARRFGAATDAVELAGYIFRELIAVRDQSKPRMLCGRCEGTVEVTLHHRTSCAACGVSI